VAHDLGVLPVLLGIVGVDDQLETSGSVPVITQPVLRALQMKPEAHLIPVARFWEVHFSSNRPMVLGPKPVVVLIKCPHHGGSIGNGFIRTSEPGIVPLEIEPLALVSRGAGGESHSLQEGGIAGELIHLGPVGLEIRVP